VLHLGMTGSFRLVPTPPAGTDPDGGVTHVRVRFLLDDGTSLLFRDPRRFGRVSVVPLGRLRVGSRRWRGSARSRCPTRSTRRFAAGLAATHAPVKARLLDQRLVAGVGNIYADEALWRARIHPASRRVGGRRALALHAAIREVLAAAIEREGTTFRDYQMVNGESGRYADFLDAYGQATGRALAAGPRCGGRSWRSAGPPTAPGASAPERRAGRHAGAVAAGRRRRTRGRTRGRLVGVVDPDVHRGEAEVRQDQAHHDLGGTRRIDRAQLAGGDALLDQGPNSSSPADDQRPPVGRDPRQQEPGLLVRPG
jgi:formamidopyrimidine-DNA glycosylase